MGEKLIAKDRRIYISTYPTMLNIIRDDSRPLSPHFFDLVVVDESHRSIYNTYQEVIDYFKAINLGLTATPTDVIDHNTFNLFHCEDGLPTFAYTYEEAVNNQPPYLSDFQVMKIQTKFQKEGISKRTISLEDQKQLILEGKDIEEINFEGTQLEKQVINKGTNTLIVKEYMEECFKDANGVLPGKTIFFCSSKAHARRMEEIFDKLYPQYHGELAKVMVSDDPRVYGKGGLLDQFTNNDMPRIAISVDMLDTGIDVREIVNLVFAKPVYSYTKFWQMIGRGTRLLEAGKIKPWCPEKDTFLILDCWDNFEYFKLQPRGKELKSQLPLPVRLVGVRLDKIEKAIELGKTDIATKETVHFGPKNEAVSVSRYREMIEQLVLALTKNNPILQKLKQGQDISPDEAEQLARLLHDEHPHITEDLLKQAYQNRKAHFIQFIRHILGIETLASFPDTVSQAFDRFIAEHSNLNSRQLEFLRLLKDFLIERETVEKRDLIQSPFTVLHPQGIRGVFTLAEIDEILSLTGKLAA